MFRGWKTIVRHADDHPLKRRKRRCLPTLAGSASCLEDRVLLSGAGANAHAAEVAKTAANLANTHAGRVVTGLYESILGTDPTSAQLTTWVHKMRSGVSSKVLSKDLLATARTEQSQALAANVGAVVVNSGSPRSTVSTSASSSALTVSSSTVTSPPIVNTLPEATNLSAVGLHVQQAPNMLALRAGLVGGSSSSTGISIGGGRTSSTTTTSSTSTSTSTTSSTSTTTPGTISPLSQLPLSQLPLSQLPLSQLPVTPALSSGTIPSAPQTGLTTAPQTGLTSAPQTGLTSAPQTGLTSAPTVNLI